jgi:glycosyltransferase involved in cell wall biosynthesis
MRILQIHAFYAQAGGEDAVVRAEGDALRARGHEVELFSLDNGALSGRPLRGLWSAWASAGNPLVAWQLRRALKRWRPDVAHVHNVFPRLGLSVFEALAEAGLPAVQTLHNYRWLCAKATFLRDGQECRLCQYGDHRPAARFACFRGSRLLSWAYGRALTRNRRLGVADAALARYICVSDFVRQAHLQAGYAPERLVVKGHFVEAIQAPAPQADGRALYVGRFSEEKGLGVLGQALRLDPGLRVSLAGAGPERAAYESVWGPQAQWLGALGPRELGQAYARASVCVVPSSGLETFGRTVIEAYASGVPVVVSASGGLPELVQEGVTGLTVKPRDAADLAEKLAWMLSHPAEARAMGLAGQRLVQERYLAPANMEALEKIYHEARRA